MNNRRFDLELESYVKGLEAVQPLLLHVCCAPCSSAVLEKLSAHFDVTVYYYNPNIESAAEYGRRIEEVQRLIQEMPLPRPVRFAAGPYEPEKYREAIRGYEAEKEGGMRCRRCFELRLGETAKYAKTHGFSLFTTTLTISPMKNAALLNEIGETAAKKEGISFLPSDFKKQNGYRRSIELSAQYALYRQDYCGCAFSDREAEERRRAKMEKQKERTYAVIDLYALRSNYRNLTALLPEPMKTMLVLKADGYGHGALALYRALEQEPRIFGVAVATAEEALQFWHSGVRCPILILGAVQEETYPELIRCKIRPTIFTLKQAEAFSEAARKAEKEGLYHLKIDTGMNRIGLSSDEAGLKTALQIARCPGIRMEGVFSHLARMDEEDETPSRAQADAFFAFVTSLRANGCCPEYVHIGNSAATIREKGFPFANLTRLGISLFGLFPSEEPVYGDLKLRSVMSLFSRITYVKTVPAGMPVSYGGTFVTARETKIATVACGYADGYPRALSNKGSVLVHGKRCPILGRICMDQFMIDVTDAGEVAEGDEVLLFGRDGENALPLSELAEAAGTITYELLCNVSVRVPRIYENAAPDR